jgi:hypothetical protein
MLGSPGSELMGVLRRWAFHKACAPWRLCTNGTMQTDTRFKSLGCSMDPGNTAARKWSQGDGVEKLHEVVACVVACLEK